MACHMHILIESCQSPSVGWFMFHVPRFSNMTITCGFSFHCLLHISLLIRASATASVITLRGRRTKRTSIAAAGAILITPVITRLANLCNLLSSALLAFYVIPGYQTVKPLVNIGLMTMVYVQHTTVVLTLSVLPNVPLQVQKAP